MAFGVELNTCVHEWVPAICSITQNLSIFSARNNKGQLQRRRTLFSAIYVSLHGALCTSLHQNMTFIKTVMCRICTYIIIIIIIVIFILHNVCYIERTRDNYIYNINMYIYTKGGKCLMATMCSCCVPLETKP